jgi:ATP-dependent protease HslVU (ClpYQ) peptidase subunit
MTCIVGLVDKGTVWLGGDSAGTAGYDYVIRKDKKVFRKSQMIFGFTSSFRMGQLIQTSLAIPKHVAKLSDFVYLTTVFIDSVMTCFKEKAFAEIKDNRMVGGQFLVGYRGKIYDIDADFQIGVPALNYEACGCGEVYAKGAMYAQAKDKLAPKAKITCALAAAAEFSHAVRPPWNFVSLSGNKRNG